MKLNCRHGAHVAFVVMLMVFISCRHSENYSTLAFLPMKEYQLSFSAKNHILDNNDNFSSDDRFLCYDTRGTVFNNDIGNCKTIEKIEISTGTETVLYQPQSITGEQAAPGVGAVSYHPIEDKVIFIHGPLVDEVKERGYYGIPNRTGVEVSADGKATVTKVDMRDVATGRPTISGAQRGGTHRHEYTRKGNRIGFTYNDLLCQEYDRTIGYMEANSAAPEGYTHYFVVLLKPAKIGESKPGEIEKAYADSWVDSEGKMRAFVGKVRSENGIDYQTDLFVAHIPDSVDITTATSGDAFTFPEPPKGVRISRLTHNGSVGGIVRGSEDGKRIVFLTKDENDISQITVINTNGSDLSDNLEMTPKVLSDFTADAESVRWHPSGDIIFSIVKGNIAATCAKQGKDFGKTIMLTNDNLERVQMVVSRDGSLLAYNILKDTKTDQNEMRELSQIFILELEMDKINEAFSK